MSEDDDRLEYYREAVETLGPPGALRSEEAVLATLGPEPIHEAQAVIEGHSGDRGGSAEGLKSLGGGPYQCLAARIPGQVAGRRCERRQYWQNTEGEA
jgi:hypothetical protein